MERARALVAALLVNGSLGLAFLAGLALKGARPPEQVMETFDVTLPPPPPPEPLVEHKPAARPKKAPAPAGAKSSAAPNPIPRHVLPTPPAPAAARPAEGTGANSGNAASGTGSGAGGNGTGTGGGGSGGIGTEARLLGGNRARLPRALLAGIPQSGGYAHLLLAVGPAGRVERCSVLTSSGFSAIDAALCGVMMNQSRWAPATDRAGRPIRVELRYTATWAR